VEKVALKWVFSPTGEFFRLWIIFEPSDDGLWPRRCLQFVEDGSPTTQE
jgi:hypothetical protein